MNEYFTESLPMRYPKNYFMQWFREKESFGQIKFNFHFKDQARYLSDVLSNEIDTWRPEAPVIISAQTGSGKNHFILETLLPKLIEENRGQKDLTLILSNRIALNRQTKHKLAKLLVEFTHDSKYITEMEKYFTNEGVDHIYINFDVVTVCSYHQLYNRCNRSTRSVNAPNFIGSIDISKFKYIVCDECHFFTSDATFNPDTGNILKEIVTQGQNAVRIYMSATPEVVVEAILREEFLVAQTQREKCIELLDEKIERARNRLSSNKFLFPKKVRSKSIKQEIQDAKYKIENLEYQKEDLESNFNLHVCFYYMARNYDYVVPHCYQADEQLVEVIQRSEDKWIIFTNTGGSALATKLNQEGVSTVFLSREGTEADEEKRDAYNFIIENETTNRKVVISTSLLDNGINITNAPLKNAKDKVLNIAIDSFDRTQFIQMLGRIRADKGVPVHLYIKEYSSRRLKSILAKDSSLLVQNLLKKIRGASPTEFNSCAVYQLVDRMSTMLTMIRSTEPDFCIEFLNPETEASKGRVYEFYKTGKGKFEPWSRSIVDLLESSWERKKRKKYIYADICNGEEDVNRHKSKLNDSFLRYLYQDLIPQHYYSAIEADYNFYVDRLNASGRNRYNYLIRCEESRRGTLSLVEKIKLLNSKFDFASKKILVDVEQVKAMEAQAARYENLADRLSAGTTVDAQLSWIEKSPEDLVAINLDSSEKDAGQEETLENYIRAHNVTASEVEQFRRGKYLDKDFISRRGIKKDSTAANTLSEKFFQGKSLKEMLNAKWSVDGNRYVLGSFSDNTNSHTTFYCFVKQEFSEC